MARLRVLTAHEIEDPELRATMEKVGGDVALCHRLLGRSVSESGRLRHGDAGHGRGDRRRRRARFGRREPYSSGRPKALRVA